MEARKAQSRALRRRVFAAGLSVVVMGLTLVIVSYRAEADPSFGLLSGSPSGHPGQVLKTSNGAPSTSPLGAPGVAITSLGLPAGVTTSDDVSFGNDNPSAGNTIVVFSVDNWSTGYPLATHDAYSEALGIDGAAAADIYAGAPAPSYATPWLVPGTPACAAKGDQLVVDGDGKLGGGPQRSDAPGLGLQEVVGPPGTAGRDDLTILDMSDSRAVDINGDQSIGLGDKPVFYTISAADAQTLGGTNSGADVYIKTGSAAATIFASAATLSLQQADDISALSVYHPAIGGTLASTDTVIFSLKPGSPSLTATTGQYALTPACQTIAGSGTGSDLWIKVGTGLLGGYLSDEQLGLCAQRTYGLCNPYAADGNDRVDAIDVVKAAGADSDGDGIDDAIDQSDDDGDGFTNSQDNCPTAANADQANTDSGPKPPFGDSGMIDNGTQFTADDPTIPNGDTAGDVCDTDRDNDGLPDNQDAEPLGSSGICAAFVGASDGQQNPAYGDNTDDDNADGTPFNGTDNGPSWDTDGDGVRDGVECILAKNPRDGTPGNKPSTLPCANFAQPTPGVGPNTATTDADGDGIPAAGEYCKWGTSDTSTDSDGDGKPDCVEANDINGDGLQTFPADTLKSAAATQAGAGKTMDFDLNGDGAVNFPGDTLLSAKMANHVGGLCP